MNIVIPMAGKSKRFFDAEYKLPKALLSIGSKTMIEGVVDLFNPIDDKYIFIINEHEAKEYKLLDFLDNIPVAKKIYMINEHDLGPVYSLLQVADKISADEEVIVNYCDFLLDWDYPLFLTKVRSGNYNGGLVSFRGFHPASLGNTYYAYIRVNDKNELLELREKSSFTDDRMREHASTGTYYFMRWDYVVKFGQKLVDNNIKVGNEYYPSLIYNIMNEVGMKSLVFETGKFICLGTPEDYKQYQFWGKVFKRFYESTRIRKK